MSGVLPIPLAVVAAAALYTAAFPPHGWWPAAWLVPALLLLPARRLPLGRALAAGAVFGVLIGWGICGWLVHAAERYVGGGPAGAPLVALAAWLGWTGVPCAALLGANTAVARLPAGLRPLAGAWLWVATEALRTTLFGGMPWAFLGHTQLPLGALVQVADLGGVPAVSFLVALASLSVGELVAAPPPTPRRLALRVAPAAALLVAALAYGARAQAHWAAPVGPAVTIAAVQAAVPAAFRFDEAAAHAQVDAYVALSRPAAPPDLILWPENAANLHLAREPRRLAELARVAARARHGLVVGAPRRTEHGTTRNAVHWVDARGRLRAHYDKRRLVPFAESDPLAALGAPAHAADAYDAGDAPRLLDVGVARLGAVVCYEVLFPGLVRELVLAGADVLANVANEGWLDDGTGAAAAQHLQMAAFRAIETRRDLVRAAQGGHSALVRADGTVAAALARDHAGLLVATAARRRGRTLYVRAGDAWIAGLGLALLVPLARRRRRRA